jgi:hypothetical protein
MRETTYFRLQLLERFRRDVSDVVLDTLSEQQIVQMFALWLDTKRREEGPSFERFLDLVSDESERAMMRDAALVSIVTLDGACRPSPVWCRRDGSDLHSFPERN